MKKLILFILLFFITAQLCAASIWHTSTIQIVYPTAGGDFVIIFDTSSAACPSTGKYHYVVVGQNGVTAEGSAKMYSAALAALLSGKQVSAYFDDSTANCYINRLYIKK